MPLVQQNPLEFPILVHDAPVNEKTKEVREMFKVDEKTGYPEQYNWRGLARLGPKYNYEDPFLKFDRQTEEQLISSRVTTIGLLTGFSFAAHWFNQTRLSKKFWSQIYLPVAGSAIFAGLYLYYQKKTLERSYVKNHILMDYARKHPERFGPVERPKVREVLFVYQPCR